MKKNKDKKNIRKIIKTKIWSVPTACSWRQTEVPDPMEGLVTTEIKITRRKSKICRHSRKRRSHTGHLWETWRGKCCTSLILDV